MTYPGGCSSTVKIDVIDTVVDAIKVQVDRTAADLIATQLVYPNLADPISITSAAGVWTPGADTEVVPVGGITTGYNVCGISICSVSVNEDYQIDFYQGADGAGTLLFKVAFTRTSVQTRSYVLAVTCPWLVANRRIYAKLSNGSAGAETVTLKLIYIPVPA